MKLLKFEERRNCYGNNFPSTSTATQSSSASPSSSSSTVTGQNRHRKYHKRFSLNENFIDGDNIDVSFAFPHDFDKYSDDIWRKTVSSDCDQSIHVWEKQPEPSWGASSRFYEPIPRIAPVYDDEHVDNDIFSTGGNFFFPTPSSGGNVASTSSSSGVTRRLTSGDFKKINRRKNHYGSKIPSMTNATATLDSDEELQTINKRLSLSALRNSLCRQKALENLNNENQGAASSSAAISGSNDDFLQVFISFNLLFLYL